MKYPAECHSLCSIDVIDDNSYVVKGNTNSMNFDEHDEFIF